jgi:hypothetical protein
MDRGSYDEMSFFLSFVHTHFFGYPRRNGIDDKAQSGDCSPKRRRYHGATHDLNLQGGVCFMDDMSFFSSFPTWLPCCAGIDLFHFF